MQMQMQLNQTSVHPHSLLAAPGRKLSARSSQRAAWHVTRAAADKDGASPSPSASQTEAKPPTPPTPTPAQPPVTVETNGASSKPSPDLETLAEAAQALPEEEAQAIITAYKWLTQHPDAPAASLGFREVETLYKSYQTLIWRPAELLNGRMAMLGFSIGAFNSIVNRQSVWEQVYRNPFSYFLAFLAVVGAQQLNRRFGSPQEGIEVGPVKFSKTAELLNARAAMVGYAIMAYTQYNQEMSRSLYYVFQQMQAAGGQGPI